MNPIGILLEFLYPSLCRQCEQLVAQKDIFCRDCLSDVKQVVSLKLPVTATQKLTVFAASQYEGPLKKLITKKFSYDMLAARQLAQLIVELTPIKNKKIDYIIPVPLHWTRYARRGFNQSNEMAKVLGKHLDAQVVSAIGRTRKTKYQSMCDRDGRRNNVQNAFGVSWWYQSQGLGFLKNKNIVLVDDLCTTGATLVQIAKILARFKPASLTAAVGCRAV